MSRTKTKKKIDKNNIVTIAVVAVLCLIFVVLFAYGLDKVMAMEGQLIPNDLTEGVTPAPDEAEDAVSFLVRTYDDAVSQKPKISREDTFDIDCGSAETDSDQCFNSSLDYISDNIEEKLEESSEGFETDFGETFPGNVIAPDFTASDIVPYVRYVCKTCGNKSETEEESCDDCGSETPLTETENSFVCDYIYYRCPSCEEKSNVPLDSCELCGSERAYEMKYSDEYSVTLALNNSVLDTMLKPMSDEDVLALMSDEIKNVCTVDQFDILYDRIQVSYKVNRLTDKLTYLEYKKVMRVSITLTFEGDYASLGTVQAVVPVTEKNKFTFTWPGLSLNEHSLDIEPGTTENLLATLSCSDPTKQTVTWTCSDTSLATVDDEGYIKAGKTAGNVTVTATFEFNGETFSDSCEVHIKYSVESMKMNKKKASLDAGETVKLKATVSPSKASIKTVTWYTEDEKIASVDDNGLVTAKNPGTVTVYALSDDGYYKSSCEVTVS